MGVSTEELNTVEYASMLYDFYGELLNNNQKEVMSLYHEDNFSLSEIADELGTTRQAVHYTLKKAEHALAEYENRLGLLKTYRSNQELAIRANSILDKSADNDGALSKNEIAELKDIINTITE